MIELRITRPGYYSRDCQNPENQDGHYFRAVDFDTAVELAWKKFPDDVELWVGIWKRFVKDTWKIENNVCYSKIRRN